MCCYAIYLTNRQVDRVNVYDYFYRVVYSLEIAPAVFVETQFKIDGKKTILWNYDKNMYANTAHLI